MGTARRRACPGTRSILTEDIGDFQKRCGPGFASGVGRKRQRVKGADGGGQRGGRHMGVKGGGAQTVVAEQELDGPDIGAGFQQMGGKAVAQRMGGDLFA